MSFVPRGFYLLTIYDLSSLPKGATRISVGVELSHEGELEMEDRFYEDSVAPNEQIETKLSGDITLKGDIAEYVYPTLTSGVKTAAFFERYHYYLFTFLRRDIRSGVTERVYCRWVGQLKQMPKNSLSPGEVAPEEISFSIAMYGAVARVDGAFYCATAANDATPTTDYDPVYSAFVDVASDTLAAAETEVSATIVNPTGGTP